MNIESNPLPRMTLQSFAEEHGLIVKAEERHSGEETWWNAEFKGSEVKSGIMLGSAYGKGTTQEEAIADYAKNISNHLLVFGAHTENRKEITVPVILPYISSEEQEETEQQYIKLRRSDCCGAGILWKPQQGRVCGVCAAPVGSNWGLVKVKCQETE